MFVFFFSFACAADQAPCFIHDELLKLAERIEDNKEAILEYWATKDVDVTFESLVFPITEESAPLYHAMVNHLVTKSGSRSKPVLMIQCDREYANAGLRMVEDEDEGGEFPAIYITQKMLTSLSDDEIETTVAHEIGHMVGDHTKRTNNYIDTLRSRNVRLTKNACIGILSLAFVTRMFSRENMNPVAPIVLSALIATSVGAKLIEPLANHCATNIEHVLILSKMRSYEYEADTFAALLTEKPTALIETLKKVFPDTPQSFWSEKFNLLFNTHPYTDDRIVELEKTAASIA